MVEGLKEAQLDRVRAVLAGNAAFARGLCCGAPSSYEAWPESRTQRGSSRAGTGPCMVSLEMGTCFEPRTTSRNNLWRKQSGSRSSPRSPATWFLAEATRARKASLDESRRTVTACCGAPPISTRPASPRETQTSGFAMLPNGNSSPKHLANGSDHRSPDAPPTHEPDDRRERARVFEVPGQL